MRFWIFKYIFLLIIHLFLSGHIPLASVTDVAPFNVAIKWMLWEAREGIALFSFGYCPYQTWMHFCNYNRFYFAEGVFLTLHSINTVEVINAIFKIKVTFTIQLCINQTPFIITRWIKNVKLALFFFPTRAGIVAFLCVFEQRIWAICFFLFICILVMKLDVTS